MQEAIFLVNYYLWPLTYTLDILQFEAVMTLGAGVVSEIAGAAISALAARRTGPGALIAGATGGVTGALASLVLVPDLTEIVEVIDEKRDELVCALANASNPQLLRSYLTIICR